MLHTIVSPIWQVAIVSGAMLGGVGALLMMAKVVPAIDAGEAAPISTLMIMLAMYVLFGVSWCVAQTTLIGDQFLRAVDRLQKGCFDVMNMPNVQRLREQLFIYPCFVLLALTGTSLIIVDMLRMGVATTHHLFGLILGSVLFSTFCPMAFTVWIGLLLFRALAEVPKKDMCETDKNGGDERCDPD